MKVHERISSLVSNTMTITGLDGLSKSTSKSGSGHQQHQSQRHTSSNGKLSQNDERIAQDEMFLRLRREAAEVVKREPILCTILSNAGLLDIAAVSKSNSKSNSNVPTAAPPSDCSRPAKSFEEVISRIVSHRLSSSSGGSENVCPVFLRDLLLDSFGGDEPELGHTMSEAVREDALAIVRRDPACETLLEAVLFMKGFHSLVLHRAARRAWKPAPRAEEEEWKRDGNGNGNGADNDNGPAVAGRRFVALLLQSQSSSSLGIDIHPACSIGKGVMIDHASGVVIGETATVGDGTTILHGVTLGGTGKDHGVDRHPKIGKDVLIGAGTKILGNISVGDRAKIGAGSVVLRPIPGGATAVGAPAKIIGYTPEGERPGSVVDVSLEGVEPLVGKRDSTTLGGSTLATEPDSSGSLATMVSIGSVRAKEREEKEGTEDGDRKGSVGDEAAGAHDNDPGGEDDDNITDFGTPAKCRYLKVTSDDDLCPFAGSFRGMPSSLRDNISHSQLRALLLQEGCTEGECVEVFFALLHLTPSASKARQCGCIPCEVFSEHFPAIAGRTTRLDGETIRALAVGDLRALGMSKKASRRFRSVFSDLGKQCSGAKLLARIPSSGSLREQPPSKSERLRMANHLDTDSYAEGITI